MMRYRLDAIVVVSAVPLPAGAEAWPVRAVYAPGYGAGAAPDEPYVVVGPLRAVQAFLENYVSSSGAPLPLYVVVTDSAADVATLDGRTVRNIGAFDVSGGDAWEAVVAAVCSEHVESVPESIVRWALETPGAAAVVDGGVELTYLELFNRAAAAALLPALVRLPSRALVALVVEPSVLNVVLQLALGLVRLTPVTLSAIDAVREAQMERCNLRVFVTRKGSTLAEALRQTPGFDVQLLLEVDDHLLDPSPAGSLTPASFLAAAARAECVDDVAFVDWTSGSTGLPKGMAVTQWKIAHWSRWRAWHWPLKRLGRRVGMGLFFQWYYHVPLAQGGTLVVIPRELLIDVRSQLKYCADHKVDWIDCVTPGQLQMLTELCSFEDFGSVKHLMASGEALQVSTARAFLTRFASDDPKFSKITLSNVLSTTETSADICALKDVTLDVLDAVEGFAAHVPVLHRGPEACVVWGNAVFADVEDGGRVVEIGWNVERGYLAGDDSCAFADAGNVRGRASCTHRSGDRAFWHGDYLCVEGRLDSVVKVRGFRVDLQGVEASLLQVAGVADCAVVHHDDAVWACVVVAAGASVDNIVAFCKSRYDAAVRPTIVSLPRLPYSATGKRDRKAAKQLMIEQLDAAATGFLRADDDDPVLAAMAVQLGFSLGPDDDFFGSGGNSHKALRLCAQFGLSVAQFYGDPTARGVSAAMRLTAAPVTVPVESFKRADPDAPIGVVGMGLRLPGGVDSAESLWRRLVSGEDLLTEVPTCGRPEPAGGWIRRKGVIGIDRFSEAELGKNKGAPFRKLTKAAAAELSPEQVGLLRVSREALEDAGLVDSATGALDPRLDPSNGKRLVVGVFVCGGSLPHGLWAGESGGLEAERSLDPAAYFQREVRVDKDFLASKLAWHFGCTGPCEVVQAACTSSLLCVARGAHALRLGLCDVAICGGVSLTPDEAIAAVDGLIWAPSGVCRPFADDASGTVPADGAAVVLLTNDEELLRRQRPGSVKGPYAVVEGVAVNNDGGRKGGFSQPSEAAQVDLHRLALRDAKCGPGDVDYVEAHGTGTRLGDVLELAALGQVYTAAARAPRDGTLTPEAKLVIGSLKSNLGHLNTVSGVAGFIKACLTVQHQRVAPTIHCEPLNALIPWEKLHLDVATVGACKRADAEPHRRLVRRAAVSAFGVGGTNVQVIVGRGMGDDAVPAPAVERPAPLVVKPAAAPLAAPVRLLVPEQTVTLKLRAPPRLAAAPPPRPTALAAPLRSDDDGERRLDEMVYGLEWEQTAVAEARVALLPVVLLDDSDDASESRAGQLAFLESLNLQRCADRYVVVSAADAPAAAKTYGALAIVGGGFADVDDDAGIVTALAHKALRLLLDVEDAATGDVDVFALLAPERRYSCTRGLLRTCRKELRRLRLRLLTVQGPAVLPALPMEAMIKGRQVHLRRIARRAPRGRVDGQKYGVAVVTGGLRGLGAVVGRYLLDAGLAESVVVVGRTPQAAAGHGVRAVVADVSDWDSVLERLPVKADLIVHCAGVLDDKLARYVDAASLASVLAPKVHGTANLLKRYPLAKVVAFSSSSAFLGPVGQATYSAANAYLDERLGRGAVQWGGWGGAGMAVDHSIEPLEGERFLALQDGLAIFRRLLEEAPDSPLKDGTPAIVLDIADWGAFGSKNPSLFGFADDGLVFDPAGRAAGGAPRGSAFDARTGRAGEHARVAAGVHVFRRLDFGKGLALQHVVQGSGVVPGTAYVCWALEALRALDEVPPSETLSTHAPTHVLRDVNFVRLWELADASSASASLTIDAHRGTVLVSSEDHVYATMSYRRFDAAKDSANDVRVSTDATIVDVSTVDAPYRTLGENGYAYGPAFSRLARVSRKSATLAEADVLSAKSDAADAASDAGVLDAVLQLASFIDYAGGGLPAVIEGFWWAASKGAGFASVARCAAVKVESGVYDVVLFGADGSVVGRANRFHLAPEGEAIKGMEWQMSSFTGGDDANDSKEDLEARRLSLEGIDVIRVDEASDVSEEMARIEACARRGPVVVCAAVGSDTLVGCALDAGVAILQGGSLKATREVLRSVALDHEDDSEAGAGHERSGTAKAQKRASRYVARVSDDDDAGVGIFFEEDEARALGPRDVELQVQMWSLSFRDVLLAKGLMSSDVGGTALGLGCECSGIVVRAGSEARFEEGTLVTCLPQSADSTMGSHLIADDSTCFLGGAADSEGCDALAASTMCYGTAWYGLVDRARIRAGDRVLIHSAAGGVGLAAVHLCLKRKCVVYGTASTPEKRDYLLSLGVSAVFDSRTICDFVTGVEKLGGCDVVLNSLSGDAIPASLALLSQGGHFVELGKRDAHADATLPQKAFLKGLSFTAAHIDVLMLSKPAKARLLFEAVREAMVDLPRLPVSASFPFSRLQDAIDHMAAGKHIGKVLVKTEAALAVSPRRRNARYVVSAMAAADSKGAKSTVDPVAAALQRRLWRPHSPDDGGVLVARLGAFGSLRLAAFDSAVASSNARVVITDSRLLARRALKLGATLAVELRGLEAWRGMSRRDLRRAMQLHGHVVGGVCDAVADSGRDCANVVLRLVSDQSKELDAGVALRSDFETLGLDSLSLITLAQRLTAALKRSVTVAMLQRSGSAERLIAELSGDAKPVRRANRGAARAAVRPPPRKRILCLHGYRSSAEIMQLQLFPFARALADYDFVYVDAPLRATGESEPSIPPETPTFEWYGAPGADYDFGWETGDDGLEASLRAVREYVSSGQFCGVVGFSQGAAIAQLLSSPEQTRANGLEWVALFSAIPSPQVAEAKLVVPSFHCYDDGEPHAHLARQVRDAFVSSRTWLHEEGHYVSRVPDVIRAFADFVRSPQPPCPEPTTAFVRSPQPRKSSNGPPPPRPDESDDEANE